MKKMIHMICLSTLLMGLLSACSTTQKITNSARTATEQLLLSEAISRSLPKQNDSPLPMPKGAIIKLDVTGLTPDKDMAKGVVAAWLSRIGGDAVVKFVKMFELIVGWRGRVVLAMFEGET